MKHTPYKLFSQAMLMVYITLQEESRLNGGASMQKLKAAYESIVGRYPCDRTIERILSRIDDTLSPGWPVVQKRTRGGATKYYLEEDAHVLQRQSRLSGHKTAV